MSRRRRVLRWAALAVLLAAAAGAVHAYREYPGVSVGMIQHWREATVRESRNLFRCIFYWIDFMGHLERDPASGLYRFPPAVPGAAETFVSCQVAFHRGELASAAACMERRIAVEGESEERLFWLANAKLRQGEAENCLARLVAEEADPFGIHHGNHQALCTLPLEQTHGDPGPSRQAMTQFARLLDEYRPGDPLYRWLLSFAAMTAGDFPAGVPAEHRVATPFVDAFYGEAARATRERFAHLSFVDRAAELGVAVFDTNRGVAVEDFDGDGDLDLATGAAFGALRFHRNEGGRFVDATDEAGFGGIAQIFAVSAADYDGDGDVDLFVGRPFDQYLLLENDGGGRFRDVTAETGLLAARGTGQVAASWAATWGDVDLDGDLDLFLAQWGMALPFVSGLLARERMDSKLFRNEGESFVDATAEMGLASIVHDEYYVGAAFGDLDGDGYPELFLSSPVRRASVLFHNEGGRRYVRHPIVDRTESGFYATFLDADHDGRLDLFQGGFSDARTSTEMTVFGMGREKWKSGHSTILLQRADGRLEEHNEFFGGADMPMATMGANYGDLDNDGCWDFYLGTGNPESWMVLPSLLYVGRRDGRRCTGAMDNASVVGGFATIQKGHGIVFFDFDGDGDEDVYSALGGMWPADAWPSQLFVNESATGNAWVDVRLRGRRTNRFGLGARVTVKAVAPDGEEIVRRAQMDARTGFGSAAYLLHFGLLDAVRIDRIEVDWPVSRCRAVYAAEPRTQVELDEAACEPAGAAGGKA